MKNNKLYSFTKTVSRVLQIIMIVVATLCVLGGVVVFFALGDSTLEYIKQQIINGNITINELGMSLDKFSDMRVIGVFGCLYGFICMVLGSLIFGNIYKVFKNIEKDTTPFTKENVRLVKYIGIYSIAAPFVSVVVDVVMSLVAKNTYFNVSLNVTAVFMGFVVLCLSQFFAYGVELEDEVEGLL